MNLDNGHCTIDGTSFMGASKRGDSSAIALDLTGKTLLTPTSLRLGGWLAIDGGVKEYKIRITSIDGTPVDNPELTTFTNAVLRNDIYDALKDTYTSDCATGAGINAANVDLSAWVGHTVNFEIVAITTYGNEVVAVRCTNVEVPEVYNAFLERDHFVDETNVKDNGTIASGLVSANKIVFDLSDVTVNADSTFKMNGWITANGGIASYKYRVIEGENVYDVAATGSISTQSGVTADGISHGFDENCAINGSFENLLFSLADVKDAGGEAVDLSGKAITVQMIAIANSGKEFVVASFNNITVTDDAEPEETEPEETEPEGNEPVVPDSLYFNLTYPSKIAGGYSGVQEFDTALTTSTTAGKERHLMYQGWIAIDGEATGIRFRVITENGTSEWLTPKIYVNSSNVELSFVESTDPGVTGNSQVTGYPERTAYNMWGWADLSDYAGQTVTVQFAAIRPDGELALLFTCNSVAVAE